jgi:hypothetical protein
VKAFAGASASGIFVTAAESGMQIPLV